MSEDEVFDAVSRYGLRLVEITGGEPLLQKEVLFLITRFLDAGLTLLLETNGSVSIKDVDRRAVIIMDIKTPKSGMFGKMDLDNLSCLKQSDELKFVVNDREDYEWVRNFIGTNGLLDSCKILLSPAYGILSPESLSRWILYDKLPVRLNLQIHKYIYGPEAQGV
jgi:7-carboxy-7-deazaguanine synthase